MREVLLLGPRDVWIAARVAETTRERRIGLIGRSGMREGEGLLLPRARSVHTFGMRFTITVALLDTELRVRDVLVVPRRRLVLPRPGVRHVLELAGDVDVREGDRFVVWDPDLRRSQPARSYR